MRDCLDEGMLQSYFDGELSTDAMADVSVHLASCLGCTRALRELESENLILSEALAPEFAQSVPTERLRHSVDAAIAGLHVVKPGRAVGSARALSGVRGWFQPIAALFTISPQRAFGYAGLAAVLVLVTIVGIIQLRRASVTGDASAVVTPVRPIKNDTPQVPIVAVNSPGPVTLPSSANSADVRYEPAGYRPPSEPIRKAQPAQVKLLPGERSYLKQIASLDTSLNAAGNQPMRPGLQAEYERNLALVNRAIAATRGAAKNNPNDPDAAEFMFAAYQSKVDLLNQVAEARLTNRPH